MIARVLVFVKSDDDVFSVSSVWTVVVVVPPAGWRLGWLALVVGMDVPSG